MIFLRFYARVTVVTTKIRKLILKTFSMKNILYVIMPLIATPLSRFLRYTSNVKSVTK